MKRVITYRSIGHTRSGQLIKVPLHQEVDAIQIFLNAFLIDDLMDIYCMVEFLYFEFKRGRQKNQFLLEIVKLLSLIFDEMKVGTYFGELLRHEKLDSPSERIKLGCDLVLSEYRKG